MTALSLVEVAARAKPAICICDEVAEAQAAVDDALDLFICARVTCRHDVELRHAVLRLVTVDREKFRALSQRIAGERFGYALPVAR